MIDSKKCVLAMYDIRSKQSFIYRSTALKEIVGGSLIIRDCFKDYLYPAAEIVSGTKLGIYHGDDDFTREGFEKHIAEGYVGELVYDGGGNFLVIYRDIKTYRDVNYRFSKRVLERIGTLQILPTCIEGVDFDNYKADRDKLYSKHKVNEGKQSFIPPWGTLPIVQVDYSTSEPIVESRIENKAPLKVSQESKAKRDKYYRVVANGEKAFDEKVLDNLVHEKGTESLLAVIYADGNNMGAAVQNCIKDYETYEDCIRELRQFSKNIQKEFIDDREAEIDRYLDENYPNKKTDKKSRRFVILSGDEITFICNARHAYEIMCEYLKKLPQNRSACAGAAIFHSHAPYSEAYRIAEECCESGKKFMKEHEITGNASFMDFYYCQGAIGISLEAMKKEEVGDLDSKPWLVTDDSGAVKEKTKCFSLEEVEKCRAILNKLGRSNVKGLSEAAKSGEVEFQMEIRRIKAHFGGKDSDASMSEDEWEFLLNETNRKLIYDMVIFFDIWFDKDRYKTEKEAGEQ